MPGSSPPRRRTCSSASGPGRSRRPCRAPRSRCRPLKVTRVKQPEIPIAVVAHQKAHGGPPEVALVEEQLVPLLQLVLHVQILPTGRPLPRCRTLVQSPPPRTGPFFARLFAKRECCQKRAGGGS